MLGEKLKWLRKERGLTQDRMAELLHMDQSAYSRIESGHRKPSAELLQRMAKVHKVEVGYLLPTDGPSGTESVAGPGNGQANDPVPEVRFYRELIRSKDRQIEELLRHEGSLLSMLKRQRTE